MKNIAIVANTSWYVYNFRKGLLTELVDQGFSVSVIAPKDKFVEEIKSIGCKFIELKQICNKGKNPVQDLLLINELIKIFKQQSIDCVLLYTPKINIYGSIATKFCSTKAIATINGLGYVFNEGQSVFLRKLVKKLYAFAFKGLPTIFFQNQEDKAIFARASIIKSSQNICVVNGSGVNLKEFYKKSDYHKSKDIIFLLSSRLIKEKGVMEYLDAAKNLKIKYPNVSFALLGVTADNPSAVSIDVIHKFHENGIIDYWGESNDMSSTLDKVDVMVLPSFYREGVPRVLIEALAKGLPVITTNNVGCKETVDHQLNGLLIPVKDSVTLQESMEYFIELPFEKMVEMGNYSRKKAEAEFDENDNHHAYIREINKVLY